MRQLMVANLTRGRYKENAIHTLLNAQIENSIDLGWKIDDIILLSNFDYEFMGVKSTNIELTKICLTGSKMFGMKYLFDNNLISAGDVVWAHDLDAWQNVFFSCPDFLDAGIACYSNSKYNGGSIFWKISAKDIAYRIVNEIQNNTQVKEEPTLNKILRLKEYVPRVTVLNNTFNVGCSGYAKRWERSIKPIRVCHFHPYNHTAWETHALDRNGLGEQGISKRLELLLRKYYPNLATSLSQNGKISQQMKIAAREKEKARDASLQNYSNNSMPL